MELATALASATTTLDLLRLAVTARDDAKARAAVADMTLKLQAAYTSALDAVTRENALASQLRAVQDERDELKRKAVERESYAEAEVSPGVYAYARKPVDGGNDYAPPYFCQPCLDKGVKTILRPFKSHMTGSLLQCVADEKHTIQLEAPYLPKGAFTIGVSRG